MSVEVVVLLVAVIILALAGVGYGVYRYRQNQLLLGAGTFAPMAVSDIDFFHSATYFTSSYWTDHYWTIAGAGVPPAPTRRVQPMRGRHYLGHRRRL